MKLTVRNVAIIIGLSIVANLLTDYIQAKMSTV